MKFTIPFAPITKKNSQQILINHKTGKRFISQSKQYIQYEKGCCKLITGVYRKKIDFPVKLSRYILYANSAARRPCKPH